MSLQESGEMYLETILLLSKKLKNVRAIDISEHMSFSKPSVSRAIGILKAEGYVVSDENGFLELTESGKSEAEKIYERHEMLTAALMSLGVSRAIATEDACKMEHIISEESFEAIKNHMRKLDNDKG